jgi:hypothetical protein
MNVKVNIKEKESEDFPLSFDEILMKEGIYEPDGGGNWLLIVLENYGEGKNSIVVLNTDGRLQIPPRHNSWSCYMFRKARQKITIELN